jgi:putative membrane protein insertion efficiency factor
MKSLLMFFFRIYRLAVSPFLGHTCRFYPTCSAYAEDALRTHGVLKGLHLTLRRIMRCHPWHHGGVDPVPEKAAKSSQIRSPEHHRPSQASN